ncbi:MAG: hypothetical protein RSB11_04680, partial [Oscillospiraceae bacterium]
KNQHLQGDFAKYLMMKPKDINFYKKSKQQFGYTPNCCYIFILNFTLCRPSYLITANEKYVTFIYGN